jgi:midasin (ATPase involved in ribosome maturation)
VVPAPLRAPGAMMKVHQSFRIFGTRMLASRHSSGGNLNSVDFVIPSMKQFSFYWHYVPVPHQTGEEIREILKYRFIKLIPSVVDRLIETFTVFSVRENDEKHVTAGTERPLRLKKFSLRDLVKVASRIEALLADSFNTSTDRLTDAQNRLCATEIVEVYAASIRDRNDYRLACISICKYWNVSESDAEVYIINGSPQLQTVPPSLSSRGTLSIGRISVELGNADAGRSSVVDFSTTANGSGKKRSNSGSFIKLSSTSAPAASGPTMTEPAVQQFAYSKYSRRLLEQVAACVTMSECVLLVGETGAGKTTSVQQLATLLGRKLVVQNLSLSTDSNDLIGGYRPVSVRQLLMPTYEQFFSLFLQTFESTQNKEYLERVAGYLRQSQWNKMVKAFLNAATNAVRRLTQGSLDNQVPALVVSWNGFTRQCQRLQANITRIEHGFAFAHVDGLLVEAMKYGHWLLLDEINLATSETLQALAGILDGQSKLCHGSSGDAESIIRHPGFRVFAAMNPPTDIGKKELPISLRCRFTEIYTEELTDPQDLSLVVQRYLQDVNDAPVQDIVNVYLGCRASCEVGVHSLVDGAGQRPRYSLRSLTRALRAAVRFMQLGLKPLNRALFEGFILNFQTLLGESSKQFMRTFLGQSFSISGRGDGNDVPPPRPGGKKSNPSDWVLVKPFWLHCGPLAVVDWTIKDPLTGLVRFVMTKSMELYIKDLTSAVAADVAPVLLQGPTSVGKTTMIEYLAARTGHRCIRINNHEHTEVAEYVGGYITNLHGQLEFKDGLLVEALRKGHWIILDELNLAPSDILEALNRLLDDNRELLIPETGEVVRPAPGFFLFATQNPPGAYGGRKPLSRAFRNRYADNCTIFAVCSNFLST